MNSEPIIVVQELNAPIEKVWKALTTLKDLQHWFFELDEFELKKGYVFTFYDGGEEQKYLHICKILEIEPYEKLSFSWRYQDIGGDSIVSFYLYKNGNNTLVKLIHAGVENFETDKPDFSRESFEKGWDDIINISLKEYVENN